jgi:hypothetical protein
MATSMLTKRAARAAASTPLLGAPEGAPQPARKRLCCGVVCVSRITTGSARQAVPGEGSLWGAEGEPGLEQSSGLFVPGERPGLRDRRGLQGRSLVVGARSALRQLTRRHCLSAESAANIASLATRPRGEHRREVAAKRRPPQREPPTGHRLPRHAAPTRRQADADCVTLACILLRDPPTSGSCFDAPMWQSLLE